MSSSSRNRTGAGRKSRELPRKRTRLPDRAVAAILQVARYGAAAAALAAAGTVDAANWDYNPRVELAATYNDNFRLAENSQPKIVAAGPVLDATFGMRSLTQTNELSLAPRIRVSIYPDDHDDQSTDGYFDLKGEHKTQKLDLALLGSYANESVIYSDLLPANFNGTPLGEIVGTGSNRVTVSNRRQLERLEPSLVYDFTQREHFLTNLEYEHASFSKNDVFQQIGYKNLFGTVGLGLDFTQRSTVTFMVNGARFEPEVGGDTTSYGMTSQWSWRRTQVQQFYVRAGLARSQADVPGGATTSNTNFVGGAGVSWTYQITKYVIDFLQGVSPSSSGAVVNHTEARGQLIRSFSPRLSGTLAVRAIRLRGAAVLVQGSDYAAATAGFQYQITRNYRLAGEYDYTWLRFQGEPNANSNAVFVSIIYQPLSRFEPLPDLNGLPPPRR